MRGIFRISLDGAAGFTAVNLKPRAIILAAAFRSRTAILTGSILAVTLALAIPVGATDTGEALDKICLKKTSYKTQGDAVPLRIRIKSNLRCEGAPARKNLRRNQR